MLTGMSLEDYLAILEAAAPDDGPYTEELFGENALALNTAFAGIANSTATFVRVAKALIGYDAARDMLEELVHAFPASEVPVVTPEQYLSALLGKDLAEALGVAPEAPLTDEADEK